jgi:hypothetical protein
LSGERGYYYNVTLGKDTLMLARRFSNDSAEISEGDTGNHIQAMTGQAEKIFKQYPSRFKKLDITLYDPGNYLIAHASLVMLNQTLNQTRAISFPPTENPRLFVPEVKIT